MIRYRYNVDYIDRSGDVMVDMVWARDMDGALAAFLRRDGWPPAREIEVHDWDAVMLPTGAVFSRKKWEQGELLNKSRVG